MADAALKDKIRDALKSARFKSPDDLVDVSDGPDDGIHIVIVSRQFDGRRMKDKNDMIWSILVQNLRPEEWGKVSLTVGTSSTVPSYRRCLTRKGGKWLRCFQ